MILPRHFNASAKTSEWEGEGRPSDHPLPSHVYLGSEHESQVAHGGQQVPERQVGLPPQPRDGAHVREEAVDQLERPRDCHEHHQRVLLRRLGVEPPDDVDVERVHHEA